MQGLVEPGPPRFGDGKSHWCYFQSGCVSFLIRTWLDITEKSCHSGRRPSCLAVHPLSRGPARCVRGRRWGLSRRNRYPKRGSIFYPWFFWGDIIHVLFKNDMGYLVLFLLSVPVAKREPAPCSCDAYSVVPPSGHLGGNTGRPLQMACFAS